MFGDAVDYLPVRIHHRKWWFFHPAQTTMAPDGHLWFHPHGDLYRDDFANSSLAMQSHFIHEMTHVWQAQVNGWWYLPLMRHPWCRYEYQLIPGKPFARYGIEQQAEIVRHAFLIRNGALPGSEHLLPLMEAILPFLPAN